jgi:hypothetical protein
LRWNSRWGAANLLDSPVPGDCSLGSLAQLEALEFASDGSRKGGNEFHGARILERGDLGLYVILKLLFELFAAIESGSGDDECLYQLAAIGIGHADHRALLHRGMFE